MKKNNRILKTGIYYLLLILLSLTVAILANLVMDALPVSLTQQNMNREGILELSDETETFLDTLNRDVTVYWIVQNGREDNYIQRLLENFEEQSRYLSIEKIDPVKQPRFASQYTTEIISQNSLIVVCGDRSRYIGYSDIYLQEVSGEAVESATFQGEGLLASALNYVTSTEDTKIYVLTGHGETELPTGILSAIQAQNDQILSLDLTAEGSVPEDCQCVLVNGVTMDLPTAEAQSLAAYLNAGGQLCLFSTWLDETTPNWNTILEAYGMSVQAAIIVEGQEDSHMAGYPYYILPSIAQHETTNLLAQSGLRVLIPLSQGLTIAEEIPTGVTVQPLLKTSTAAYGKTAGFAMQTTEREDSDLRGSFLLGAVAERTVTGEAVSRLIWFPSSYILDDTINEAASGGNSQLLIGCIQYLTGGDTTVTVPGKALGGGRLMVPQTTAGILSVLLVAVIPIGLILAGVLVIRRRKRR